MIRYRRFVADAPESRALWDELKSQIYLGSNVFVAQLQRQCEGRHLDEIPKHQTTARASPPPTCDGTATRDEAIVQAWHTGGYTMKEIGDTFGLHYSRVSRIIAKARSKT
jgi:hypothetical protein